MELYRLVEREINVFVGPKLEQGHWRAREGQG